MSVLVNLFGAPGAGKSTTATGVFSEIKRLGVNAEYVPEVAKDFTWEERAKSLTFQAYVHAKQLRNIERLIGKVDVIITDSPPLLSAFYGRYYGVGYPDSFFKWVQDCHTQYLQPALHYYLRRVKTYNTAGRNQTEEQSDEVALAQLQFLNALPQRFRPTILDGDYTAIQNITQWVRGYLRGKKVPRGGRDHNE
jgi:hypothetical protein